QLAGVDDGRPRRPPGPGDRAAPRPVEVRDDGVEAPQGAGALREEGAVPAHAGPVAHDDLDVGAGERQVGPEQQGVLGEDAEAEPGSGCGGSRVHDALRGRATIVRAGAAPPAGPEVPTPGAEPSQVPVVALPPPPDLGQPGRRFIRRSHLRHVGETRPAEPGGCHSVPAGPRGVPSHPAARWHPGAGRREVPMDPGDAAWVLASAALVMFMTPGLALFYGGMDRRRNVLNMLMMNFWCLLTVPVLWAVVGYSLAQVPADADLLGGLDDAFLRGMTIRGEDGGFGLL